MKYYDIEKEKVLKELNTRKNGLTNDEVEANLDKYGKNELPKQKQDSALKIFFST